VNEREIKVIARGDINDRKEVIVVVVVAGCCDVVGGKFLDVYRRTLFSHFNFFINIFDEFLLLWI